MLQKAGFNVKAAASSVDEADIARAFSDGRAAAERGPGRAKPEAPRRPGPAAPQAARRAATARGDGNGPQAGRPTAPAAHPRRSRRRGRRRRRRRTPAPRGDRLPGGPARPAAAAPAAARPPRPRPAPAHRSGSSPTWRHGRRARGAQGGAARCRSGPARP